MDSYTNTPQHPFALDRVCTWQNENCLQEWSYHWCDNCRQVGPNIIYQPYSLEDLCLRKILLVTLYSRKKVASLPLPNLMIKKIKSLIPFLDLNDPDCFPSNKEEEEEEDLTCRVCDLGYWCSCYLCKRCRKKISCELKSCLARYCEQCYCECCYWCKRCRSKTRKDRKCCLDQFCRLCHLRMQCPCKKKPPTLLEIL